MRALSYGCRHCATAYRYPMELVTQAYTGHSFEPPEDTTIPADSSPCKRFAAHVRLAASIGTGNGPGGLGGVRIPTQHGVQPTSPMPRKDTCWVS
jgi:hypothetical protein